MGSDTVPGGRYISEDGITFHDANGKILGHVAEAVPVVEPEQAPRVESAVEVPVVEPEHSMHMESAVEVPAEPEPLKKRGRPKKNDLHLQPV